MSEWTLPPFCALRQVYVLRIFITIIDVGIRNSLQPACSRSTRKGLRFRHVRLYVARSFDNIHQIGQMGDGLRSQVPGREVQGHAGSEQGTEAFEEADARVGISRECRSGVWNQYRLLSHTIRISDSISDSRRAAVVREARQHLRAGEMRPGSTSIRQSAKHR